MNAETQKLVADQIGYVHTLAAGFTGRGVDHDDLVQAGMLVLCEIADEYDPKAHANVSFGQFARLHLIRAFGREIRSSSVVPAAARVRAMPLSAAKEIAAPEEGPEGVDFWAAYRAVTPVLSVVERRILSGWFGLASRRGPGSVPATVKALSIRYSLSRRSVKLMLDRGLNLVAAALVANNSEDPWPKSESTTTRRSARPSSPAIAS